MLLRRTRLVHLRPGLHWGSVVSTRTDKPPGRRKSPSEPPTRRTARSVKDDDTFSGDTIAAHDMGAPPALLWASEYPDEVSGLVYIEVPVMLQPILEKIIVYTPEAMARGSMWWWILPLAPGVPEILMVGKEREFPL